MFKKAVCKFPAHFSAKDNPAYKINILRQIRSQPGDTADQFVASLRQQARLCSFFSAAQINEEVWDQLVASLHNTNLKTKRLRILDLTITKALEEARLWESTHFQATQISPMVEAHTVTRKPRTSKPPRSAPRPVNTDKPSGMSTA